MAFNIKSAKQKKALIIAGISVAVLAVGFTIAYNHDSMFFNNLFGTEVGVEEYVDEFVSPTSWQPCEEVSKEAYVTNKNTSVRYARMKIDEYWRTANSQTSADDHTTSDLPLTWNDGGTVKNYAVINLQNTSDWELKADGWYYYKTPLQQNQSTSSLLESVALNCDANLVNGVTYSQDGLTGESVPTDYAGATYHVYVTMQLSGASWEEPEAPNSLYGLIRDQANDDQYQIDFRRSAQVSADESTANGNGVNKATENGQDVYYYRGVISDNNVIWAGQCWKMLRTTAGGGTKMIYSGAPTNGTCVATGYDVMIETLYNNIGSENYSPGQAGYKFGAYVESGYLNYVEEDTFTFSNNVTRSGNTYTLDTSAGQSITGAWGAVNETAAERYHYICLDGTTTCDSTKIAYIYAFGNDYFIPYLAIGGYDDIEAVKSAMFANTTNSTAKTVIDNWFVSSGLVNYENDLEDAVYCNDRSITTGAVAGKDVDDLAVVQDTNLYFSGYIRNNVVVNNNLHPSLDCANKNDAFTKSDTTNGNGELTYPIGLITADEATMAGYGSTSATTSNFLFSGKYGDTYTMTPHDHGSNADWLWTQIYYVDAYWEQYAEGKLGEADVSYNTYGVRPVVTLKHNKAFSSGDGTSANPYIVQ